jgi:predicted component of type VI protein secretion system
LDITTEDFRRHFDLLSDEALLDTKRDELTEVAQQCLDDELAKRGLHAAAEEVPEEDESAANEPSAEEEELAVVATYDDAEEADGAKALLDEAKIPSRLVKDAADMEGTQMELLVPATDLFKALDTLGLHLSDEELAAQAEAAGMELDE